MFECCIHSASTLWDLPTTVLARFFELYADVIDKGDPDVWEHFTPRHLALIFSQIAASQAHPPKTVDEAMAALIATVQGAARQSGD
jgi:hypothetical protein